MLWWEEQSWQSWWSWIKKLISVAARYAALWSAERRRSTCQLRIVPGFSSIICLYLWSGWVARRSKRTASQWLNGGEHISGNGAATVAPVPRRAQKTLADLLDPKSNYLIQSTILAIRAKLRSSLACGTCGFVIRFVRTCMSRLYIKDSKLESTNLRCKEKRSWLNTRDSWFFLIKYFMENHHVYIFIKCGDIRNSILRSTGR